MKQLDDTTLLLERYVELVLEKNRVINLTSITDSDEAAMLLLEDSLAGAEFIEAAPSGAYADLGTGGGFPGVPLGVVSQRETWLVESRRKKLEALTPILETLGIRERFVLCPQRIEELSQEHPEYFSVVTARALTALPSLVELASPLLCLGGRLVSYQAVVDESIRERAAEVAALVGMQLVQEKAFKLSDNETQRTILVYEKIAESTITLPRRNGVAQKRPLA